MVTTAGQKERRKQQTAGETAAGTRSYAVGYATVGTSYVLSTYELAEGAEPTLTRMKDPAVLAKQRGKTTAKDKKDFLRGLTPGDHVYLELGGPGDRLALAALAYGAKVYRYPSYRLGKEDVDRILMEHTDWVIPSERARDDDTGDKLTARKRRAYAIMALARVAAEEFLPVEERHVDMLRLATEFRAFKKMQRRVIGTIRGLIASYYDRSIVELGLARQFAAHAEEGEARRREDVYSIVLEQVMQDLLGGEISAEARADFLAALGARFPEGIPADATHEDIEDLVALILESDRFESTILDRLKAQQKRIEKLLYGGKVLVFGKKTTLPPNAIWEQVFEPIPGMGPLIAAPIITEVGDIRAFRSRPALTAAAGYHHNPDGSRARRVKGKASPWKPRLKQAVWQWCQQTVKMPQSPWRVRLDQRKAYELWKIMRDAQAAADAEGHRYEIMLPHFTSDATPNVNSFADSDYLTLCDHVDDLRKQAGVTVDTDEEDEGESTVKDPVLAGYVKGVKKKAHDRGLRWLGQQLLKHIWREWRKAVGMPEDIPRPEAAK